MNILKNLIKSLAFAKPASDGDKLKIFISQRPEIFGGGSSTFARLFKKWAINHGHIIVKHISRADLAIVIAHLDKIKDLKKAKKNNCFIIHRLDEHFEKNEIGSRKKKHEKIIELNQFADITVFQSQFVFNNVYPFINPENYKIIYNGGDQTQFYPGKTTGSFIGHVTWGIGQKKRLDILHDFIRTHPEEQFLLVGRQGESEFEFNMSNVEYVGKIRPEKLPDYLRKMKMLYFPSENDPCPNTVVESILCGVPICYNIDGGTVELVKGDKNQNDDKNQAAGLPLERADEMLENLNIYRQNCRGRKDLYFDRVFNAYLDVAGQNLLK